MSLTYDQLPKAIRDKVDATMGAKPRAAKSHGDVGGHCPYRCVACDERFDHWGVAVERHRDRSGHGRYEMVLGG